MFFCLFPTYDCFKWLDTDGYQKTGECLSLNYTDRLVDQEMYAEEVKFPRPSRTEDGPTHTSGKPWATNLAQNYSKRISHEDTESNKHTETRKINCLVCPETFDSLDSLRTHLEKVHANGVCGETTGGMMNCSRNESIVDFQASHENLIPAVHDDNSFGVSDQKKETVNQLPDHRLISNECGQAIPPNQCFKQHTCTSQLSLATLDSSSHVNQVGDVIDSNKGSEGVNGTSICPSIDIRKKPAEECQSGEIHNLLLPCLSFEKIVHNVKLGLACIYRPISFKNTVTGADPGFSNRGGTKDYMYNVCAYPGFLLIAGNRLFFPAVKPKVAGCWF